MQAAIYVTAEAMATAIALQNLGYYERAVLSDDPQTDLSKKEGYYLKNASRIKLAVLPADAVVAVRLMPSDPELYNRHIRIPSSLRGCVFENSPHLPPGYAQNVAYWSGPPLNTNTSGAAYYQNPQQAYMVDLSPLHAEESWSPLESCEAVDQLLSEGVVVCIDNVRELVAGLGRNQYIELQVPAQLSMLGYDLDELLSTREYGRSAGERIERVYIKVSDIEISPDQNHIFIDLLRYEMLDYGWTY